MWTLRWRRLRYRGRAAGTPLEACWSAPLPNGRQPWQAQSYLVCDAEMSSLEIASGKLLSLGWVAIDNGRIALASAEHHLVASDESVGQSAGIHQLRDCDLEGAESEEQVMARFCAAARGRVLVFHHAPLDLAYLNRASKRYFGVPLLLPHLDTLTLELRRFQRREEHPRKGELTLAGCRQRYGLPDYPVHNALVDALATAELFLAIAGYRGGLDGAGINKPLKLEDLI
ncbi:exonuclease domain-containing protein [Haliea sp. E17]|uniref:3'-5' exonuclease n=1 Tax=Haliea sp. E17 TaxID=3401576 RepID=UPI003AAB7E89